METKKQIRGMRLSVDSARGQSVIGEYDHFHLHALLDEASLALEAGYAEDADSLVNQVDEILDQYRAPAEPTSELHPIDQAMRDLMGPWWAGRTR